MDGSELSLMCKRTCLLEVNKEATKKMREIEANISSSSGVGKITTVLLKQSSTKILGGWWKNSPNFDITVQT